MSRSYLRLVFAFLFSIPLYCRDWVLGGESRDIIFNTFIMNFMMMQRKRRENYFFFMSIVCTRQKVSTAGMEMQVSLSPGELLPSAPKLRKIFGGQNQCQNIRLRS